MASKLIYAGVFRENVTLAEFSVTSFRELSERAKKLLNRIKRPSGSSFVTEVQNSTFSDDKYNYLIVTQSEISYLCASRQDVGVRLPSAFLYALRMRFNKKFPRERIRIAAALGLNSEFAGDISELIVSPPLLTFSHFIHFLKPFGVF